MFVCITEWIWLHTIKNILDVNSMAFSKLKIFKILSQKSRWLTVWRKSTTIILGSMNFELVNKINIKWIHWWHEKRGFGKLGTFLSSFRAWICITSHYKIFFWSLSGLFTFLICLKKHFISKKITIFNLKLHNL